MQNPCDSAALEKRKNFPGDDFTIAFSIKKEGTQFRADNESENVLACTFEGGKLEFSIKYDFLDKPPMTLEAPAKCGDQIKIHVLPHRLELYINDVLSDEEWPCGNHFLAHCPIKDCGCSHKIIRSGFSKTEDKTVIGTFENAEGWKPEENVFVGDCMPYSHDGAYHVLYLKDRRHHRSKWGLGAHQWNHISTRDFIHWSIHPTAVEIDDKNEGSICTGSWIMRGETHYLFYTIRMCDGSPAKICRSVSEDGFHYQKDRSFSFTLSQKYVAPSARDPKVIKSHDGLYHMILTSSLSKEKNGCLVHLVSKDLTNWTELESPLYIAPEGMGEPECPDYFFKDGYYYLVYSLHGKGYYKYSKAPFDSWQTPENPIIPCKSVPKAAIWKDEVIFAGFDGHGRYAGTMTFLKAEVQKDGLLKYHQ
ncbi:MAG: hypothetical protein IKJ65_00490 [Clostridia bacterium]|nr:hypothetical protein [Clostridia bacterium]